MDSLIVMLLLLVPALAYELFGKNGTRKLLEDQDE